MVNDYVGIKWLPGGRDHNEGLDCWGFLVHFFHEEMKIELKEQYPWLPGETKKIMGAMGDAIESNMWVRIEEPEECAAVALSMGGAIHHVGVWHQGGCLHATKNVGVVYHDMSGLKRNGYQRVEFYRYNG